MPLTTNTLTLSHFEPDNVTPINGTCRVKFVTEHGKAINDDGHALAGSDEETTTNGVATFELPDTEQEGFEPAGAYYLATFVSTDRRVRLKSEPFLMDGDKTWRNITTTSREPITLSLAAQAEGYRDEAQDAAVEATAAAETVAEGVAILEGIDVAGVATAATTATTKASEAATSATNAASSATTASTAATNAGTSATAAGTSATSAAASATAADAAADLAAAYVADLEVGKIRDWFAAAAWPARGTDPGPRWWIGPASVGNPPELQTGDTYDAVQGV